MLSRNTDIAEMTWLEAHWPRYRMPVNLLIHSGLFALALLVAYLVRYDSGMPGAQTGKWLGDYLFWLPYFIVVKLIIFHAKRLLHSGWAFAGIRDIASILKAAWIFLLITFIPVLFFRYMFPPLLDRYGYLPPAWVQKIFMDHYSNGVLVLDFFATVFLVSAARLGYRIYREELRPISSEGIRRVLVIGAGNAAETIIREINRMRIQRYRVVGMVDDEPGKMGLIMHGVPVLGATEDIPNICKEHEVEELIIAMPSASQKELRRVIELCSGTKLKFQSLPGLSDLIDRKVTVSQIRPVEINDLLGRATVELDNEAIGRFIHSRTILITGAGGSIGSEMARQVCRFGPARLILLEQAETPLFDIDNELRRSFPDATLEACICDIFDRERVMSLWQQLRPDVVIHAAAHKHVPLMERNPSEAVKNNILGTRNVADASCQAGVADFVMISTDKAVNPSSVMGASKRVAEIYTQTLNGRPTCPTQFKAVRFGNVLGSSGSVIPTFRKQIAAGGPVTITHPEMTRYFMTIPEAAQLVLQAASTGQGGQIFLLDMGEPVKIVDLARQMITLSGFRPGGDIDIVFTGVRPGEKLFEELRTVGENIEPTVHPKVMVWKCQPTRWETVQKAFERFEELRNCTSRDTIIEAIQMIVPEYTPLNPPQTVVAGASSTGA